MTQNNNVTLQEYAKEVLPNLRSLDTKTLILKEWEADQDFLNQKKAEIKAIQEEMKAYVESNEPDLLREIKDLKTDIGLAVKAMVKGTEYKSAQMKQYLASLAKDKVDEVIEKAELFSELEGVLN